MDVCVEQFKTETQQWMIVVSYVQHSDLPLVSIVWISSHSSYYDQDRQWF